MAKSFSLDLRNNLWSSRAFPGVNISRIDSSSVPKPVGKSALSTAAFPKPCGFMLHCSQGEHTHTPLLQPLLLFALLLLPSMTIAADSPHWWQGESTTEVGGTAMICMYPPPPSQNFCAPSHPGECALQSGKHCYSGWGTELGARSNNRCRFLKGATVVGPQKSNPHISHFISIVHGETSKGSKQATYLAGSYP